MVSVEAYGEDEPVYYPDKGVTVIDENKLVGWSYGIRSSKDLIQFDYEDMKTLTEDTKKSLC
jgi:hypothetical protein